MFRQSIFSCSIDTPISVLNSSQYCLLATQSCILVEAGFLQAAQGQNLNASITAFISQRK